jgi:hypothetical protein
MIRPIDLQTTILSAQNVPSPHRAEDGTRTSAQAAQAAFAAELTHREESVAPAAEVLGNRIDAKPEEHAGHGGGNSRKRKPASAFEQVVDEAAGVSEESPHIVDFTA